METSPNNASGEIATSSAATVSPPAEATRWNVDADHTSIGFSVRHFFTPVSGVFDEFEAALEFDPAHPDSASFRAKIVVASINTNNAVRDGHLQSADFFDAQSFPFITFASTSVRPVGDGRYVATGDLTIRDVKRSIDVELKLLGVRELDSEMSAMFGGVQHVASFAAETSIKRNDHGVGSGSWAETAVLGDDVQISITLEANRAGS